MKRSVKFYTLGCKTNQYETQAIREELQSSGAFKEVDRDIKSDIYIINTCTVTAKADKDSRYAVRHCFKENPSAQIVVTGCLTQMDEGMVRGLSGVSCVVKNNEKHKIAAILTNSLGRSADGASGVDLESRNYTPLKINNFKDRDRAFIKIQDGCDSHCSYCKIPLVRGGSRSRPQNDITDEIKRLIKEGFKEVVLTGICLGDWGRGLDGDLRLSVLLERIDSIAGDFRVRLSSIEPNMVTVDLLEAIAASKRICPHLHIPLQSGSDRILKLMKRPYTGKGYRDIINRAKRIVKDISITSDVMVGFPGESDKDFKDTVRVIRHTVPSRLHIFSYSKRVGTLASSLKDDVGISRIKARREYLKDLAEETSYKYRRRFLNKKVEGLVEARRDPKTGLFTGYTERYIKFFLQNGQEPLAGKLIPLKVSKVDQRTTFCKHLS